VIPNATISAVADSPAEVIQAAWNRCRLAALRRDAEDRDEDADPITAPICWNIETIALPVAVCSGARLTVADAIKVGNAIPTCSYGEPAEQKAAHVVRRLTDRQCEPVSPRDQPGTAPRRRSLRSGSLVFRRRFSAIPAKIGTITGPGALANPVLSAE